MYLFWRYLGVRPSEYEELPYWEKRLGSEGIYAEQPWVELPGMMEKPYDRLDSKDLFRSEFLPEEQPMATAFDLQSAGLTVKRVAVRAKE